MPCEFLVAAQDLNTYLKGDIVQVRDALPPGPKGDEPPLWGRLETIPNFIQIRCTDAEKIDFQTQASESILGALNWQLLNTNAEGRRYRIWINPAISALNNRVGVRSKLRNTLVERYNATIVTQDPPNEAVVDIPNTNWQEMRDYILGRFENRTARRRRYHFNTADVDTVVQNHNGRIERTKAQIDAVIIDRLA